MTDLCVAADLCVAFDRRQEPDEPGDRLCDSCIGAGESAVKALVFDYVALEQELARSLGQWGDGQPAASDDHPEPMRLDVKALQEEIGWVLEVWEGVIRDVQRLSSPEPRIAQHEGSERLPRFTEGTNVQRAVDILKTRVRELAKVPPVVILGDYPGLDDGECFIQEKTKLANVPGWRGVLDFSRLHYEAQKLLGLLAATPERCLGLACKYCDNMNVLLRIPGSDDIECGFCKREYTAQEYRDWAALCRGYKSCPECDERIGDVGPQDLDGWVTVKPCGHRMLVESKREAA